MPNMEDFELMDFATHKVVKQISTGQLVGNIVPFGDDFVAHKTGTRSSNGRPIGVGVYPTMDLAFQNVVKAHERRRK